MELQNHHVIASDRDSGKNHQGRRQGRDADKIFTKSKSAPLAPKYLFVTMGKFVMALSGGCPVNVVTKVNNTNNESNEPHMPLDVPCLEGHDHPCESLKKKIHTRTWITKIQLRTSN